MSDILFALAVLILWTAGVVLASWKYLKAKKAKNNTDMWIWLLFWGAFVLFIEWPVFFLYVLILGMTGVTVEL